MEDFNVEEIWNVSRKRFAKDNQIEFRTEQVIKRKDKKTIFQMERS